MFLKSPLIIGLIAFALTYAYLYYCKKKELEKQGVDTNVKVSLIKPGIVGVVVWFLASQYFSVKTDKSGAGAVAQGERDYSLQNANEKAGTNAGGDDSDDDSVVRQTVESIDTDASFAPPKKVKNMKIFSDFAHF